MIKSLKEISWDVDEPTYRSNEAISYSLLSTFERTGFEGLPNLFDKAESSSLTFGSAVDALITEPETFDKRFFVANFPNIWDSIINIDKVLYAKFGMEYHSLKEIPDDNILGVINDLSFQKNWNDKTRIEKIRKEGDIYYSLLSASKDKVILDQETFNDVKKVVNSLKTNERTSAYFSRDEGPDFINDNVEKLFQLKFKGVYNDIDIRCMPDLVIVFHDEHFILPVDLKTTKSISSFMSSFYKWGYFYQAKMYSYLLKQNIENDNYFNDFEILPYQFIAIDKTLAMPVIFEYNNNLIDEDVIDDCGKKRLSWTTIINDLYYYIHHPNMPLPIDQFNELNENNKIKIKTYEA